MTISETIDRLRGRRREVEATLADDSDLAAAALDNPKEWKKRRDFQADQLLELERLEDAEAEATRRLAEENAAANQARRAEIESELTVLLEERAEIATFIDAGLHALEGSWVDLEALNKAINGKTRALGETHRLNVSRRTYQLLAAFWKTAPNFALSLGLKPTVRPSKNRTLTESFAAAKKEN